MGWLISLAVLPGVLCGVMCVGGMVLAALGWRRSTCRSCPAPTPPGDRAMHVSRPAPSAEHSPTQAAMANRDASVGRG